MTLPILNGRNYNLNYFTIIILLLQDTIIETIMDLRPSNFEKCEKDKYLENPVKILHLEN